MRNIRLAHIKAGNIRPCRPTNLVKIDGEWVVRPLVLNP